MTTVAIEVNDSGLVAVGRDGRLAPPSPGFALIDGGRLLVGEEAERSARLEPYRVYHRFWDRLDTEPLPRPFPQGLRPADLVHAHLARIWAAVGAGGEPGKVTLAVPGSFDRSQLGLLLGIARGVGLPVNAVVDAALAAASTLRPWPRLLHLDLLLHRFVWTELEWRDQLVRARVEQSEATGLVRLRNRWAKRVAQAFVRQTRFDPLHRADSEQALYDLLPAWLATLTAEGSALLVLSAAGSERTVELSRADLEGPDGSSLEAIVEVARMLAADGEEPLLALSSRAAGLPGLAADLAEKLGALPVTLPETAAAAGALAHLGNGEPGAGEVPFVTRLQVAAREAEDAPAPVSRPDLPPPERLSEPTHLAYRGTAHPITAEPLWLGVAVEPGRRGINLSGETAGISRNHCSVARVDDGVVVEDASRYGTLLNGRRVAGRQRVVAGDRLRLGSPGLEVELIRVAEEDG